MDMLMTTLFQGIVALVAVLLAISCALFYFQRVRLERPAIGVFNPRDIVIVLGFIVTLPMLYLVLPGIILLGMLVLTFVAALYMGMRPLLPRRYIWLVIPFLLIADTVVTELLLGTRVGWQVYWIINSTVVLLAVVGVSNLYVQGGMQLRHVAWFALVLAFYDGLSTFVFQITSKLADRFAGQPLDPSMGFSLGVYSANIGLGDLLIYCLFLLAAYKGFGKRGAIASFAVITIFGVVLPSLSPLIIASLIRGNIGIVVPAQASFGPAALITYFWLSRHVPERSMSEWFSVQAAAGRQRIGTIRRARPATEQSLVR
nr:hypothetical protein [Ktedonobacteraceae bacterium]